MLATRGGSRTRVCTTIPTGVWDRQSNPVCYTHGLNHRWGHEDAAPSRYNHGFEPAMATRGGRRPRFEPSMATRGRRPPQHANSEQGAGRPRITTRGGCRTQHANSAHGAGRPRITTPSQNRKKGRGWHTNREGGRSVLVSHLAISCRDPKQFARTLESIF